MYYQFDSRLNMPAIRFDDDRIVVAGKEYYYTDLQDIEITKAPLLSTYGIMELRTPEKSIPVPFAKADLHRLRTAVGEAKHIVETYARRKRETEGASVVQADQPEERRDPALDPYEEMKKLKELLDLDIVTQEEFDRKKKELLGL
jgi:hypothetical protein